MAVSGEEWERVQRNARPLKSQPRMRALATHVLGPVTHFPFEEWWTEQVHVKIVARPGPELPPVFREMYGRMLGAIEAEKERRRGRGDHGSVERFEREWEWIIDAE